MEDPKGIIDEFSAELTHIFPRELLRVITTLNRSVNIDFPNLGPKLYQIYK